MEVGVDTKNISLINGFIQHKILLKTGVSVIAKWDSVNQQWDGASVISR